LRELGAALSDPRLNGATILINGHTDGIGGDTFNKKLSERRAVMIKGYAAQQGWCVASLALGIDLPRRYALGDVPRVPTIDEVSQLLEATATGNDPVTIRDHASP